MQLAELKKPFDPKRVSWRVGSTTGDKSKGLALAYIDARDVQDRLDEVCGMENWQCRYALQGQTTICEIGVKIGDEWVWKADGAGSTDVEAEKGSVSDAFKRAAVKWGVGRYLYDVESPWVELEAAGKSYRIKADQKGRLEAVLRGASVPKTEPEVRTASETKPAQSQQPPIYDKAKKAEAWVARQMEIIATFKTAKELSEWENKSQATIVDVAKANPDMHRKLLDYVMAQYDALNPVAA